MSTKPLSMEEFQKLSVGDKFWLVRNVLLPNETREVIGPLTIFRLDGIDTPMVGFTAPGEEFPKAIHMIKMLVTQQSIFLSEEDAKKHIESL